MKCAYCEQRICRSDIENGIVFQCDVCKSWYHYNCDFTGNCADCGKIKCSRCDTVQLCYKCDEWYCSECATVDTCHNCSNCLCEKCNTGDFQIIWCGLCGEAYCNKCKSMDYWYFDEYKGYFCPDCWKKEMK